jgi:biotin carboxyl carrier protein
MAGKVVGIDVQPGQSVEEGENLITLEAMKMNTFVTAPQSGTVASIEVKVGDPVEEGQALLTLS